MTLNRYLAAFLSFILVVVGAVVTIPSGALNWQAGVQLGILGVSTAATLLLPLVPNMRWQGFLKTGAVILLALLNGVTPLVLGGRYDHVTIGLIVLAGLQALASEIGVSVRVAPRRISGPPAAPAAPAVAWPPATAPPAAPAPVVPVTV